jgi:hypothetical protein
MLRAITASDSDQLPLSFVAGIFSMNAREINGYTRPVWHIMAIMSTRPLLTIFTPLMLIAMAVVPTTIIVLKIAIMLAYAKTIRRAIPFAGRGHEATGRGVWVFFRNSVAPLYQWLLETTRGPGEVISRAARRLAVCCAVVIGAPFIALWSVAYMVVKGLAMCLESVGLGALVRFWSPGSSTSSWN